MPAFGMLSEPLSNFPTTSRVAIKDDGNIHQEDLGSMYMLLGIGAIFFST
jgi:hypothetical protein